MTSEDNQITISHGITPGGLGLVSQGSIPGGPEATVEVKWKTRGEAAVNLLRAQRSNELRLRTLLTGDDPKSHWAKARRIRLGSKVLTLMTSRNHYDSWLIRLGLLEISPEGLSLARGKRLLGAGTRRRAISLNFSDSGSGSLTDTRESLYEAPRGSSPHVLPEQPLAEADALDESAEAAESGYRVKKILPMISLEGLDFRPVLENPLVAGDSFAIPAGVETWDQNDEPTTANRLRRIKVTGISQGHYAIRKATEEESEAGYLGAVTIVAPRVYWSNGRQNVELTEDLLRENELKVVNNPHAHEPLAVALELGHYDLTEVLVTPEAEQIEAGEDSEEFTGNSTDS